MDNDAFLQHLTTAFNKQEPFLPGQGKPELRALRHHALARAQTLGIPSVRLDDWKHARFDTLINNQYMPYLHASDKNSLQYIEHLIAEHNDAINIVFLNGHYVPSLSNHNHTPIRLQSLARLAKAQPELLLDFQSPLHEHDFFSELNQAFCTDGAVVIIPEDHQLDKIVMIYHILFNSNEQSTMIHPQTYIHMGKNSHAVIVESCVSISQHCNSLFNSQTIVLCEQGSRCELTRTTNHTPFSLGFHHLDACLMSNSQLTLTELAWGAHYQRHTMRVSLKEPSSTLHCHGLLLPNTYEHCDWNSKVTHYAASGNSEQRIRSVIGNEGHSSFLGNIAVNQAAQQTTTLMVSDSLLLGEKGQADNAPQLEILADEVKCNHAATISQLDEKTLFYLQSRGFSQDNAKKILLHAFTKEITQTITHPTVLAQLQQQVNRRVAQLLGESL